MPDARSDGSLLPITSLAVLAVALFGGVFVQGQLESKRPVKEFTTSLSLPGGEDIDARLWQDPSQAIRDFEQALTDRARRACLDRMRLALSRSRAESSDFVDPYEMLIEDAEGLRTGAFSPLSRNPVLAAILVPSGGLTLMTLAELIVTYTN